MCSICQQTPCPPRCPNYTPPKTYHTCDFCEDEIQIGETYIESDNGKYAHYECFHLSGIYDMMDFLGLEIKIMEN